MKQLHCDSKKFNLKTHLTHKPKCKIGAYDKIVKSIFATKAPH